MGDEKIQVVASRVREFSHDKHNSFVYIVNNTHFIISAYKKKNKMQPTNPNANTYVNGTDVKTHGFAITQNTFLQ